MSPELLSALIATAAVLVGCLAPPAPKFNPAPAVAAWILIFLLGYFVLGVME
jgi:hypothetical protein